MGSYRNAHESLFTRLTRVRGTEGFARIGKTTGLAGGCLFFFVISVCFFKRTWEEIFQQTPGGKAQPDDRQQVGENQHQQGEKHGDRFRRIGKEQKCDLEKQKHAGEDADITANDLCQ